MVSKMTFEEAWSFVKTRGFDIRDHVGEGRQCDKIFCENEAVDHLGPGNWCSEECMEAQRAYDGE